MRVGRAGTLYLCPASARSLRASRAGAMSSARRISDVVTARPSVDGRAHTNAGCSVSISGFVASLARPGGNATGFVVTESSLGGKWLELLREIAPRVTRVAALFNPAMATYAEYWLDSFKAAAASFAVEAIRAPIHDSSELESIIAAQAREPNSGLFVLPDSFTFAYRVEIVSLAARYRLPAVYGSRFFTAPGGLLSYGNDLNDNFRRAGTYADRILKGEKPSE